MHDLEKLNNLLNIIKNSSTTKNIPDNYDDMNKKDPAPNKCNAKITDNEKANGSTHNQNHRSKEYYDHRRIAIYTLYNLYGMTQGEIALLFDMQQPMVSTALKKIEADSKDLRLVQIKEIVKSVLALGSR